MPIIQINNLSIYHEIHGQGAPLVLISGLGTSRLFWWKQIAPLAPHFRTIILDNRGIGDSARLNAPFTIADMADDVAALIRALNLGPSHILGISMGGFIAATLAVRHADLVCKLILSSTSAGGATHVPPGKEILDLLIPSNGSDIETYTRQVYTAIAGAGYMQSHPDELDTIVRNVIEKPLSPETYFYQLNAINAYAGKMGGVNQLLDQVTAPTLVVHGDQDPLVPKANGQYLAAHIHCAKLLTYAGVGHLPPIEATDRFNRDVVDFLKSG